MCVFFNVFWEIFGKVKTSLETFVFFMLPCFHDFTEKLPNNIKKHTHTHGSMKKTNVSSEVLILLKNLENMSHRVDLFWAPRWTPKWVQEQAKTGSLFGSIFGPISGSLLGVF